MRLGAGLIVGDDGGIGGCPAVRAGYVVNVIAAENEDFLIA